MADEQSNRKSIDERLAAITMNLKLQIRKTERLLEALAMQSREDTESFAWLAKAASALRAVSEANERRAS